MKTVFFCSTPNSRGIHQYCQYVERLVSSFSVVRLRVPKYLTFLRLPVYRFLHQLLWELFPSGSDFKADFELFSSPRLPIRSLLFKPERKLCGVFLHDFIQCIDHWSPRSLWSLYSSYGFLELSKRIVHTIHFKLSLRSLDFLLFNSEFTSKCFADWSPLDHNRLSAHSIVLHPSPSFSRTSVEKALELSNELFDPSVFRIHIVTGFSPSKGALLLEQCISSLSQHVQNTSRDFEINIFGYSSPFLQSLSSPDFKINCLPHFVDETSLIHSSLRSDVFLSTSFEEGFGIPLLDSTLFGLDCVCTPIPAFREISST